MKRLYILRHGKSSWDNADLADFDRPLNERGLGAAAFMGEYMASHSYIPEEIVCSPAKRTRQTAEILTKHGGFNASIAFEERIYEASPHALLGIVLKLPEKLESVLLIGHNPGIEGFIRNICGQIEPMPTAALAVIDLDVAQWFATANESGKLLTVVRPKSEMKPF